MKVYKSKNGTLKVYKDCYIVEYGPHEVEIPNNEDDLPKCRNWCALRQRNAPLHCDGVVIKRMHDIVSSVNAEIPSLAWTGKSEGSTNRIIEKLIEWGSLETDYFELCTLQLE